ncbi:PREDICTED: dihydrofolate reductase-like [Bactrocera latifrons]|uniref:dihydrofolate reductase-like n=1 Tax=Bactrocera latifrons TaxID=174628 RepID=UPI0008DDC53B|nr:PREDICTED: dihydrofolate reductase-like [Bactrocera latifrons]
MLNFNLIAAVCENSGIGLNGDLPWSLKSEYEYFTQTTKRRRDITKHNVVIMGRRTYLSIPEHERPLADRINVVLSSTLSPTDLPTNVFLFPNLVSAMKRLEQRDLRERIENVWIVGGSGVYREAMSSPRCHRLYITNIKQKFNCDIFFPKIPNSFKEIGPDPETPLGVQEENGVQYEFKIYQK